MRKSAPRGKRISVIALGMLFHHIASPIPRDQSRLETAYGEKRYRATLAGADLELGLALLIDLREADHEDAVLLGRLSEVYVDFLREEDSA